MQKSCLLSFCMIHNMKNTSKLIIWYIVRKWWCGFSYFGLAELKMKHSICNIWCSINKHFLLPYRLWWIYKLDHSIAFDCITWLHYHTDDCDINCSWHNGGWGSQPVDAESEAIMKLLIVISSLPREDSSPPSCMEVAISSCVVTSIGSSCSQPHEVYQSSHLMGRGNHSYCSLWCNKKAAALRHMLIANIKHLPRTA